MVNNFEKLNLQKIPIKIDDLLLDPNNPRFSKHPDLQIQENEIEDPEVQEEALRQMTETKKFEIDDLMGSIKSKGFAQVDNIFIKKIKRKYLVIEGNRRITAVKLLLKQHNEASKRDKLPKELLDTLLEIECYDLTHNTSDQIDFILGLRHHGSIMQWDFLPSAFNIYKRYMKELCNESGCKNKPSEFYYDPSIAKKIKNLYSIKLAEVRDKLRAYRTYLQLLSHVDGTQVIDDNKFSIIHDAIKDQKCREWLKFDEYECTFTDEGADKFVDLVFGNTDKQPVITAASAGESNLRDFVYVLKNGTEEEIERIVEDREAASVVKADVKAKVTTRTLLQSLTIVATELEKITLKEFLNNYKEGLGQAEKDELSKIKRAILKIDRLSEK